MSWDAILKQILEYLLPYLSEILMKLIDKYFGSETNKAVKFKKQYVKLLKDVGEEAKRPRLDKHCMKLETKVNVQETKNLKR